MLKTGVWVFFIKINKISQVRGLAIFNLAVDGVWGIQTQATLQCLGYRYVELNI